MKPDEQFLNERQFFDDLLGDDHFDDSVGDRHQSELRAKVLQAFTHPIPQAGVAELRVASVGEGQTANRNRSLGYAMILAGVLVGFVAIWFFQGSDSGGRWLVGHPPTPDISADSQLLAALAQVNAYRDQVSPEELFHAMYICQLAHVGRTTFDSP
jgi:hypothetical protein